MELNVETNVPANDQPMLCHRDILNRLRAEPCVNWIHQRLGLFGEIEKYKAEEFLQPEVCSFEQINHPFKIPAFNWLFLGRGFSIHPPSGRANCPLHAVVGLVL